MVDEKYIEKTKNILDPIVDVFACSDGGLAFTKMRHGFFPNFLKIVEDEPDNAAAQKTVEAFEIVSRYCEYMLKSK